MSSSRASALASAALASSRTAQTYPRAPPMPSVYSPPTPASRDNTKGKARAIEEDQVEEEWSILSSRQKRLSRAARFGSSNSSSPVALPKDWISLVDSFADQQNKQVLRTDYLGKLKDQAVGKVRMPKNADRAATLHLTTIAPGRYAAIYSVLRQVQRRLGSDEEGLAEDNSRTWSPSKIVEYSCASGEGLWAAREVFGSKVKDGKGISSYLGIESNASLLKTCLDLIESSMLSSEDVGKSKKIIASQPLQLHGIDVALKTHHNSAEFMSRSQQFPFDESVNDRGTLIVCSYTLLHQFSDKHRKKFVQSLWRANPSAEVIVFIEEADERGFAAIASARELVLGIGTDEVSSQGEAFQLGRHTFYDEAASVDEVTSDTEVDVSATKKEDTDWHVVAPCPHDKPCPLLHDFTYLELASTPTTRTSRASSPLFHGATLDMNTCSFPVRLHRPEHLKLTTHNTRSDESVRYSYLVIRRGPRPTVALEARKLNQDEAAFIEQRESLRRGSQKTKIGDIEGIRAGSKRDSIIVGEEIEEGESTNMAVLNADDFDEDKAREELLKLLPEALSREMKKSDQGDGTEMEEAIQLAHDMMKKTAEMASVEEEQVGDASSEQQQDILLASAFLDQARQMSQTGEEQNVEQKEPLLPSDIDAMKIESYQWPRLVKQAIKRSGHVTFDVCSHHGSIDRFTVSKSSGKQVYQDARKSDHGDIFPHVPFSDEEGFTVGIKSQITRVPAAGQERSGLPGTFRKEARKFKKDKKSEGALDPTSQMAIGPDRVSPARRQSAPSKESKSRRSHYQGSKQREYAETRGRDYNFVDGEKDPSQDLPV